jgi:hypothetical protein
MIRLWTIRGGVTAPISGLPEIGSTNVAPNPPYAGYNHS